MKKTGLFLTVLLIAATCAAAGLHAQETTALRPPKGAKLALVVFEDLECPDCARATPLLEEAARTYSIPLVIYDFPLPQHKWAFDAAVLAKYFGTHSPKLEQEFRDYIYKNQMQVTPANLRGLAERFAEQHKTELPFVVDPQGQLAAAVTASKNLGERVGISHTPTIYVVTNRRSGTPFVEVVERSQLFQLIDQMRRGQ